MNLPFTVDQFLGIFDQYNRAVWPVQVLLVILAVLAVAAPLKRSRDWDRITGGILAFLWLWAGIVYQWIYFTEINKAAYLFGALFVLQGFVFFLAGVTRSALAGDIKRNAYSLIGGCFILYALVIYPLLGYFFGHVYPRTPTFGLPCPTTIFTFGMLLLIRRSIPIYVLLIPVIWAVIGSSAALALGIREDFGLLIAGILGAILILIRNRNLAREDGMKFRKRPAEIKA